jgi:hypothetical protein
VPCSWPASTAIVGCTMRHASESALAAHEIEARAAPAIKRKPTSNGRRQSLRRPQFRWEAGLCSRRWPRTRAARPGTWGKRRVGEGNTKPPGELISQVLGSVCRLHWDVGGPRPWPPPAISLVVVHRAGGRVGLAAGLTAAVCPQRADAEHVALAGDGARGRRGSDRWGSDRQGSDRWGSDRRGSDRRGSDRRGSDRRGSDRRGSDSRRGSDRRGSDIMVSQHHACRSGHLEHAHKIGRPRLPQQGPHHE